MDKPQPPKPTPEELARIDRTIDAALSKLTPEERATLRVYRDRW